MAFIRHCLCFRSFNSLNVILLLSIVVVFIYSFRYYHVSKVDFVLPESQLKGDSPLSRDSYGDTPIGLDEAEVVYRIEDYNDSCTKDVKRRMKFQEQVTKAYCANHLEKLGPPSREWLRKDMYKHLLYNDEKKIIFCYVPKVSCSNWKRMFLILDGRLSADTKARPSETLLSSAKKLLTLPPAEREWRLKNYLKFTMLRDPLERLVSAYLNKIAYPLGQNLSQFPDNVKVSILKMNAPEKLQAFEDSKRTIEVFPTFEEFVKYFTAMDHNELNEHFKPFSHLCYPCFIRYDWYGNFKFLPEEAFSILDYINVPHNFYDRTMAHPGTKTSDLMPLFYSNMNTLLKLVYARSLSQGQGELPQFPHEILSDEHYKGLVYSLSGSLELYYAMFPLEEERHTELRNKL